MTILIDEQCIKSLVTMDDALEAVEEVFREQGRGQVINVPRVRAPVKGGILRITAGVLSYRGFYGVKISSTAVFGRDAGRMFCLYREASGELAAIVQVFAMGAMRTGAASGIATKYLANEDDGQHYEPPQKPSALALADTQPPVYVRGLRCDTRSRTAIAIILREYTGHVGARFCVVRYLVAGLHHRAFAGVIGGQRQIQIVLEHFQQKAQIARAAMQVFQRIPDILDRVTRSGLRHQLHQADGAGGRPGLRVVARFHRDDGVQQRDIQVVFACDLRDQRRDLRAQRRIDLDHGTVGDRTVKQRGRDKSFNLRARGFFLEKKIAFVALVIAQMRDTLIIDISPDIRSAGCA